MSFIRLKLLPFVGVLGIGIRGIIDGKHRALPYFLIAVFHVFW